MEEILAALTAQQAELSGLLEGIDDDDWQRPSRCEGWTVADVVVHVAQTNELAIASATGQLEKGIEALSWSAEGRADSVDASAEQAVALERGVPGAEIGARWQRSADELRSALAACDPSARVQWVAGELAARTLATTRLAETWIHTVDVAHAFGIAPETNDRLRHIARLAWRTLPYAFAKAGRPPLAGPVALSLRGPGEDVWDFAPDDGPATTVIEGDALEWCQLAGRRVEPADTGLRGTGPDVDAVLQLVRTYA